MDTVECRDPNKHTITGWDTVAALTAAGKELNMDSILQIPWSWWVRHMHINMDSTIKTLPLLPDWFLNTFRNRPMDHHRTKLCQWTAGHESLRRIRVRAHDHVIHRSDSQYSGILWCPEGSEIPAAHLLHNHLHPLRDHPNRWHLGVCVPGEGGVHNATGDACQHPPVRQ